MSPLDPGRRERLAWRNRSEIEHEKKRAITGLNVSGRVRVPIALNGRPTPTYIRCGSFDLHAAFSARSLSLRPNSLSLFSRNLTTQMGEAWPFLIATRHVCGKENQRVIYQRDGIGLSHSTHNDKRMAQASRYCPRSIE